MRTEPLWTSAISKRTPPSGSTTERPCARTRAPAIRVLPDSCQKQWRKAATGDQSRLADRTMPIPGKASSCRDTAGQQRGASDAPWCAKMRGARRVRYATCPAPANLRVRGLAVQRRRESNSSEPPVPLVTRWLRGRPVGFRRDRSVPVGSGCRRRPHGHGADGDPQTMRGGLNGVDGRTVPTPFGSDPAPQLWTWPPQAVPHHAVLERAEPSPRPRAPDAAVLEPDMPACGGVG